MTRKNNEMNNVLTNKVSMLNTKDVENCLEIKFAIFKEEILNSIYTTVKEEETVSTEEKDEGHDDMGSEEVKWLDDIMSAIE